MSGSLRDVVVVVGAGGMGHAIARRIAAGRKVLLADVDAHRAERIADELAGDGHVVVPARVDVSEVESVTSLAALASESGSVVNVVHTAGLSPEQAPVEAILAVDLLGVALTLDAFQPVIAPGGAGVVIASMAGHFGPTLPADAQHSLATAPSRNLLALPVCAPDQVTTPQAAYILAKRANHLRVAAAAAAWGERGARINTISPGVISTAMGRRELGAASGDGVRAMIAGSGVQRIGTPEDIAAATEFLLSSNASFITGTDLIVDGGVTAAVRPALTG
ncbi:SDR family oxidoreductase [Mycobacterium aquaticum]|uniref:Short-chain dehydrogenase n=1 Tax=Mycobacterium aquaticum TaxID=1927124 RepID=A0A1X0AWS5_9MYCO|nr:SDR family oxidoreductase [Mycobacterium aquaticum]ORA34500.1 short-chain dehydrogenase [Mycobacterium aquaticum]